MLKVPADEWDLGIWGPQIRWSYFIRLYLAKYDKLKSSVFFYPKARSYARSKTQIENEKRHFSIWIFRSEEKSYLMRSDFGDFRAAFFDLAFSIATSYRNGGDFRSEKMAIEKYCAIRYQGVCMIHSQKPRQIHQKQCKTLLIRS